MSGSVVPAAGVPMLIAVCSDRPDPVAGVTYAFEAEVWEWASKTSWFFASLPHDEADDIEERHGRRAAGFGSVRVEVTIGSSTWRTSLFPSNEERTYVLPLKKAVRVAEGLAPGSAARVSLVVVTD